jgi:hypothetical protein
MAMGSMGSNSGVDSDNKGVAGGQELVREQIRREVKGLVKQVADGYRALQSLMEQNPWLAGEMDAEDRQRKRAFDDKLRKGLERANDAPRCRWVRQDGTTCGSPQLRDHIYCYAHRQMMEARALALRLPAIEDANAIQVALMRVQKALIDDHISVKKAGVLFYSLQLAITNVGQTTFGKANDDELVTDTMEEDEALSNQHSVLSQNWEQKPLTTEGTEDTEGKAGSRSFPTFASGQGTDASEDLVGRKSVDQPGGGPIFTRDIPGLREYQKLFTAEDGQIGTSGHREIRPSERQNQESFTAENTEENKDLPRMSADERGTEPLQAPGFTAMRMGPSRETDCGQTHAKMG